MSNFLRHGKRWKCPKRPCTPTAPNSNTIYYGPSTMGPRSETAAAMDYRLYTMGGGTPAEDHVDRNEYPAPRPGAASLHPSLEIKKEMEKVIHVESVDLHIEENTKCHHTDKFECTQGGEGKLVIRRGDYFCMSVTFNRPYKKERDDVQLIFTIDDNPLNAKTLKLIETADSDMGNEWKAVIVSEKKSTLNLCVYVSADCVIGEWAFTVKSILQDKDGGKPKIFRYKVDPGLVILLNPWCPVDMVHFRDYKLLPEYVLNDIGALFTGTHDDINRKPWFFGQFQEGILEICLHLLRKSFGYNVDSKMADPVQIARGISRIVNQEDDDGLLVGQWEEPYHGGVHPWAWAGSVKILQQYEKTGKPVKYGQCWVFSAVTTTVCRALGLPCRSVTNFKSGHDTDATLTIDTVFEVDAEGIPYETDFNTDSIWNFHVWNEVWMKRPQLKKEYSGWQALDATPQETSEGVFMCGPCPVEAIKEGDVTVPYDAPFIFAEVNADRVWFIRMPENPDELYVMSVDKSWIGRNISTKAPTGNSSGDREDLTHKYKHEGQKEREAVAKAVASSPKKLPNYEVATPIQLALEDKDHIVVGESFSYQALVSNTHAKDSRTVDCVMVVMGRHNRGSLEHTIKVQRFHTLTIKPKETYRCRVTVAPEDYLDKLPEGFAMEVQLFALVKEDHRYVSTSDHFRLRCPDLEISGPRVVKPMEEFKVTIKLRNPLPKPLTKCKLRFEGTMTAVDGQNDLYCRDVPPKKSRKRNLKLRVESRTSQATIIVSFDCEELPDITGNYTVTLPDPTRQ